MKNGKTGVSSVKTFPNHPYTLLETLKQSCCYPCDWSQESSEEGTSVGCLILEFFFTIIGYPIGAVIYSIINLIMYACYYSKVEGRPQLEEHLISEAVRDYRKNRENGLEIDDPLDWDFDLCLISELSGIVNAKERKIYISLEGNYVVRDPFGAVQEGSLLGEDGFDLAKFELSNISRKLKDLEFKEAVLKITTKRDHTPHRPFPAPSKNHCTIIITGNPGVGYDPRSWQVKYTEGGKIKQWMKEKDANYLARLKQDNRSQEAFLQPPEVIVSMDLPENPNHFFAPFDSAGQSGNQKHKQEIEIVEEVVEIEDTNEEQQTKSGFGISAFFQPASVHERVNELSNQTRDSSLFYLPDKNAPVTIMNRNSFSYS
ncbi:MAG: hypothetical protein K0R24_728 [Gammaproteobacteria bacterium]|jgi:hypothetical protein|nr:hypothetical protein [Gammaproteobacteria bacterium]